MSAVHRPDVVVLGGGIAGLWTLHELCAAGYDALLFESRALGQGQSIQAQGIIHGGGKYALRRVADRASIHAIREMPTRWLRHREGALLPTLSAARVLSPRCWLWLPRHSWSARVEAWGLMPLLRYGGLLAVPPVPRPMEEWPPVLRGRALRAYSMDEPVFDTGSVLECLAAALPGRVLLYDAGAEAQAVQVSCETSGAVTELRLRPPGREEAQVLRPRAVVLCAGAGNEILLRRLGISEPLMQRRPLRMLLARGRLPELFGHCVQGGRTRLTVTSFELADGRRVWQLGGELAERHADDDDGAALHRAAMRELGKVLPGLALSGLELSSYSALRAEGRHQGGARPGGVQLRRVRTNVFAAWPTKWALAPILAAQIRREIGAILPPTGSSARTVPFPRWPRPPVAAFPWEQVQWSSVP
jgi:glycine/D-amino acid oxidase-like deaminating enzyme